MTTNHTGVGFAQTGASRRSRAASVLIILFVTALAVTGLSTHTAVAAQIEDPITSVSIREDRVELADVVTVDLEFDIPDDAVGGDFFTFTVPSQLILRQDLVFPVLDPDTGEQVATASVEGRVVTFVLTDYVNSRTDVTGMAFFNSRLNRNEVGPNTTTEITFETDSGDFPDTITTGPTSNRSRPNKFLNAATGPNGEPLRTGISTGIIPESADGADVKITDTTNGNSAIVCSSLRVELDEIVDNNPQRIRVLNRSEYTATCTPTGWEIDLTVTTEFVGRSLRAVAWVTIVNDVDVYRNTGEVTIDNVTTPVSARRRYSQGGGNAGGVTPTTTVPGDTTPSTTIPGDTTPVPGDSVPAPGDTTPVPGDSTPAPGDSTPAPGDSTPVPGDTTTTPENPATGGPNSTGPSPTSTLNPTTELPATGSSSTPLAIVALASLLLGVGILLIARRTSLR